MRDGCLLGSLVLLSCGTGLQCALGRGFILCMREDWRRNIASGDVPMKEPYWRRMGVDGLGILMQKATFVLKRQ